MSYLQLPAGIPDFHKAVISLWFRVPQQSIDDMRTANAVAPPGSVLLYAIPLITFGPQLTEWLVETVYTNVAKAINYVPVPGTEPVITVPTSFNIIGEQPISPSFIGFDGAVIINLQLPGRASLAHLSDVASSIGVYSAAVPPSPPIGYSPAPGSGWGAAAGHFYQTIAMTDTSDQYNAKPEAFYIQSPVLAADRWHHLLLSFDLSKDCITHGSSSEDAIPGAGTTSACQLWLAIDDINYNNTYDRDLGFVEGSSDHNAILPDNAIRVTQDVTGISYNIFDSEATYFYHTEMIPANSHPLGIPAPAQYLAEIYPAELAELQFFTGVTLDTSIENNRRAFVGADGKPVDPNKKASEDDPQSGSIEWLGQRPGILLHGSSDWIAGKNTGPMIPNPDYDSDKPESAENPALIPDPAKQFTPTGKIVSYTPDPSLDRPPPDPMRLQRRIRAPA
jgi:hypothetical protein